MGNPTRWRIVPAQATEKEPRWLSDGSTSITIIRREGDESVLSGNRFEIPMVMLDELCEHHGYRLLDGKCDYYDEDVDGCTELATMTEVGLEVQIRINHETQTRVGTVIPTAKLCAIFEQYGWWVIRQDSQRPPNPIPSYINEDDLCPMCEGPVDVGSQKYDWVPKWRFKGSIEELAKDISNIVPDDEQLTQLIGELAVAKRERRRG